MKILGTILCIAILVFAAKAQRTGSEYINYSYRGVVPGTTLPNGVKHLGGGLIGNIDGDPVYGISQVSKGKIKMLWLESSTGKDSGGVTGWRVLDVLSFYSQRAYDHILFAADPSIECTRNGRRVENLVGIGRIIRRQGIYRPSNLWRTDLKTGKFYPASAAGIKCTYSEP
jgi:hypothetical protein